MSELFRSEEMQAMQRQLDGLRATVNVLEQSIAAHAVLIARVQAEVLALKAVRLA